MSLQTAPSPDTAVSRVRPVADSPIRCRRPRKADGTRVWELVDRIAGLDDNSTYCNLLQCTHFADTCALAESSGRVLGWMSAYRPPTQADALFVWQVAVDARARGRGVARRLMRDVLARDACRGVRWLHSTITRDNAASWALFSAVARDLGTALMHDPYFERDAHFDSEHATEHLVRIGPFDRTALARAA